DEIVWMAHEREPDVGIVALEHPRSRADTGLGAPDIAELLHRFARQDPRGRRGDRVEEPRERRLEGDPHGVAIERLDSLDLLEHGAVRVVDGAEEALEGVLDVARRQLAAGHGRLRMPAHAAAQLE